MIESRRTLDGVSTSKRGACGFTLVELLVVITILGILASVVLFALAGVTEDAKRLKTRATVEKINAIVMQKYDSYRTRRVPIDILQTAKNRGLVAPTDTVVPPAVAAQLRLSALHELMRMEMPDRWTDVRDDSTSGLTAVPAANASYRAALRKRIGPANQNQPLNPLPTATIDPALYTFQGAECLYLFVTLGSGDPDIMEQFARNEIGDVDGDGFPEFLDGWGNPIAFLRWAPGFHSPLQPDPPYKMHDSFDPLGVCRPPDPADTSDKAWFLDYTIGVTAPSKPNYPPLVPLIYSAGPDGIYDINTGGESFHYSQTCPPTYSTKSMPNNPYFPVITGTTKYLIGLPEDLPSAKGPADGEDNSVDNITSHDLSGS